MLNGNDFTLDVQDLAESIDLSALVLDRDLHLRFLTSAAASLLRLDAADVDRHAVSIPGLAQQPHLIEDASEVLATGNTVECLVLCPSSTCMVRRSQPYRSREQAVKGVVVTFAEISIPDAGTPARKLPRRDRELANGCDPAMGRLTARQREIMALVLAGHPSKRIAAELGISSRTVENHRASIMQRTGCRSIPELTRFALGASIGLCWA